MSDPIETSSLERLLADATPGPWRWNVSHHYDAENGVIRHITAGSDDNTVAMMGWDWDSVDADAQLIALAPSLASEILSLRTRLALVERVVEASKALQRHLQRRPVVRLFDPPAEEVAVFNKFAAALSSLDEEEG